jgi:hypothetical protein
VRALYIIVYVNRTTIIIVAVIVLLLIGGGGFFLFKHFLVKSPSSFQNAQNAQTQATISPIEKKSLKDLLSITGQQQCAFNDKQTGSSVTVYSGNGKVRGDFQPQATGDSSATHMIADGKYIYFWDERQGKGYKASLEVIQQMSGSMMQNYASQAMDLQKKVDYSCHPWAMESEKFIIPTDITFTDYTSMMQQATGNNASSAPVAPSAMQGSQAACGQCDKLPSGAREQCRASLHC